MDENGKEEDEEKKLSHGHKRSKHFYVRVCVNRAIKGNVDFLSYRTTHLHCPTDRHRSSVIRRNPIEHISCRWRKRSRMLYWRMFSLH